MRKILFIALLMPVIALSQEKLSIGVMELDGPALETTDLQGLSNRLRTELFNTGEYNVIERSRMDEILKEQGFQQTGCINSECAIEAGQLIGVSKIVIGSIDKVGTIYTVDIRMVDVATGKIEKTSTEDCNGCELGDVLVTVHNVAMKLAGFEADGIIKHIQTSSVQQTVEEPTTCNPPCPEGQICNDLGECIYTNTQQTQKPNLLSGKQRKSRRKPILSIITGSLTASCITAGIIFNNKREDSYNEWLELRDDWKKETDPYKKAELMDGMKEKENDVKNMKVAKNLSFIFAGTLVVVFTVNLIIPSKKKR